MASPKTILWDLETTHNLAAVFGLAHNDYINPDNIVQERYIVCVSWKELDRARIHSVSTLDNKKLFKRDPHNDKYVCEKLHEVLSDADMIVAHNGNEFDIKFTEARMLYHGLPPLPPIPSIDTLKVARKRFLFNSNKLDYLGQILKVGRKKPTTNGLWLKVLQGDAKAIRQMVRYNRQDVLLLERVYKKLQPYMDNHPHQGLWNLNYGEEGLRCPRCGSPRTKSKGLHHAITRVYQRRVCLACGGYFRNVKADKSGIKTRII